MVKVYYVTFSILLSLVTSPSLEDLSLERGRHGCHIVIDETLPICFQSLDKVFVGRGKGMKKR